MEQDNHFSAGVELAGAHHRATAQRTEFTLLGRSWELHPGVYAPTLGVATRLFSQWIDYPVGGSFLEIGCGTGVTAVCAALAGCARVTAVDITPAAVANTRANARRHGVEDRLTVVHGDLFDALDAAERFDVIFWNSNVVEAPAGYSYHHPLEQAVLDPGYSAHQRYLRQGLTRLNDGGRLLLGFNSLGSLERLRCLSSEAGCAVTVLAREAHAIGGGMRLPVEVQLLRCAALGEST